MRYKIVLKDMSSRLSEAKQTLNNHRKAFREHFTKRIIFKDMTDEFNGWITTLGIICYTVGKITLKPKDNKFKEKEYINLFFDIINEPKDIDEEFNSIILEWRKSNPKIIYYPEPTNSELIKYFNIYQKLIKLLLPLFISKEEYSRSYYIELLTNFFNNNLN